MADAANNLRFYKMYESDSKVYLLNHFKSLHTASLPYNANLNLNGHNLQLEVDFKKNKYIFYPQFFQTVDGELQYVEDFSDNAICFIGWRPYHAQTVNHFLDKIHLKDLLAQHNFLTPEYSTDINYENIDVIVKFRDSSFGKSLHGPFKHSRQYPLNNEGGAYFEKFIFGKILKISYWNHEPVVLEQQEMPTLIGDGKKTILELAQKRSQARARAVDDFQLDEILDYQDKTLTSILAPGEKVLADFRYESALIKCYSVKEITLPNKTFERYMPELNRLGNFLFSLIRQENIEHLFYSVDAILSEDNTLWILEANSNPCIHQSAYPKILKTLYELK